jgi:CheY-like chemotaxis protein
MRITGSAARDGEIAWAEAERVAIQALEQRLRDRVRGCRCHTAGPLDRAALLDRASRFGTRRAHRWAMLAADAPLVLIVEPHQDLRDLFCAYLESAGYRVDVATNGEDALRKANAARHDVIVTETRLEGLDGYSLCRRLREDATLPIIVVTGAASRPCVERAYQAGASVVITKPCFPDDLVAALQRLTRTPPRTA